MTPLGRVFVGALLAVVFSLFGYAIWFEVNDPGHGTVTSKHYRPSSISCTGHPIMCTTHPECYELDYTDGQHDGDVCVAPAEYEQYKIGDYYPAGAR